VAVSDNRISVSGNPVVTFQFPFFDVEAMIAANKLTTTKIARGQMAPLVEVHY
jgi:hypothetical protein